jgi:malonyl CoA-acyl carrier protein transacylase
MAIMQKSAGFPLWVALPGFALDLPNPLQVAASVTDAIAAMKAQGMPANTPLFYGGHSLGSVIVQVCQKSPSSIQIQNWAHLL